MKVIFLDIDGVLNCSAYRRQKLRQGDYSVTIESQKLQRLKSLVMKTGATIVLSSSWRKYWMREGSIDGAGKIIEATFALEGLSIADKTPVLENGSRSLEIEQWLKDKGYIEQYVILDDNDFLWSKMLRSHWVCCPGETGLTDHLVEVAVNVLKGKLLTIEEFSVPLSRGLLGRIKKKCLVLLLGKTVNKKDK